ncbi:inhibitor of cysteine proteases, putative (ICP) [Plasmodium ovale curtisi]|uniref:Inhibitor of cysteine proteases, putative (ICP) n=1 Tax=Plasmodium ovale curtisi TaxID=864141 RepID=A0A1A8VZF2_PLAOA|nr:inhibitor of cysteine proteases, putative (ICP) [Plasmodium ovale curtisi]SBS85072.1 inhibitor of cysteine proteases, putative (ICP) [Plasmodium ovale curtisi]
MDNNSFTFDIVNRYNWMRFAKRIFSSTTPTNFTIIPYSYVSNSDNTTGNENSVLLIRKKLKDTSADESSSNNSISDKSSSSEKIASCIKSEGSTNSEHGKKTSQEEKKSVNSFGIPKAPSFANFNSSSSYILQSLPNTSQQSTSGKMSYHSKQHSDQSGRGNVEQSFIDNISEEYKPQKISDVLMEVSGEERVYELTGDEVCDHVLELGNILHKANEEIIEFSLNVNNVLCVNLEAINGNGYVWALLGVNREKPQIEPANFPTKKITKSYFSNEISVTQPKAFVKGKSNVSPSQESNQVDNLNSSGTSDNRPKLYKQLGGLVGGASVLQSKIKAHKSGLYYIIYSYYRPFDPTTGSNTKIVRLNVQ